MTVNGIQDENKNHSGNEVHFDRNMGYKVTYIFISGKARKSREAGVKFVVDKSINSGKQYSKIGKKQPYHGVTGMHSLHTITSENGRPTINFTMTKNMVISSFFPHKDIHKRVLVSHMYCL